MGKSGVFGVFLILWVGYLFYLSWVVEVVFVFGDDGRVLEYLGFFDGKVWEVISSRSSILVFLCVLNLEDYLFVRWFFVV